MPHTFTKSEVQQGPAMNGRPLPSIAHASRDAHLCVSTSGASPPRAIPLLQQAAKSRLIAARQRLRVIGIDLPIVTLQQVEHMSHKKQLLPR